jgi:DNA polymerase-3 subunit delta'
MAEFREEFLRNPYLSLNNWFGALNSENKQAIIPVEESNDVIRELSYTSYEGGHKFMIIWHPEKMNSEAANTLLKILEEPPEQTYFILVTSASDQLLTTILSRVQQIPFYKIEEEAIISALERTHDVSPGAAKQAALLCDGNYNEALRVLEQNDEQLSFLQHFQTFMRLALKFDCEKAFQWIDANAVLGREKQKQFLQYALEIFRNCLMYNFGSKGLIHLGGNELQFLEKFAPFVTQKNYEKLSEEFNLSYYYIERNANPKILFFDLLLKTNELINLK